MWRSFSLRNRLVLIFASLFALWLVVDAAGVVIEASARARAETESAMRLTQDFVASAIARLEDAPDPRRAAQAMVASLQHLRHVRVGLGRTSLDAAVEVASRNEPGAPRWFRALVDAPSEVVSVPVAVHGRPIESIVIVADPSDEIEEAWTGARDHALIGLATALAALGLTHLLVSRAVRPLGVAGATLTRLGAGDFSARAEDSGPPEIRNLNEKINALAEALDDLNRANAELIERAFNAHDEERRKIAHELHDEFGPHLFSLRASAAVLVSKSGGDPAIRAAASAIEAEVEALQSQNRRILADLRPAALEELGLADALAGLVAHWRRAEPDVIVSLDVDPSVEAMGERLALTAYRFVQEAMTNAFRHARASRIDVSVGYETSFRDAGASDPKAGWLIRIADDGRGLQGVSLEGMGLSGMRGRVRTLGGEVVIGSSDEGGVAIEARLPGAADDPDPGKIPGFFGSK
jgi:two-component system, NarL family, sensor histidine kinase UhpB